MIIVGLDLPISVSLEKIIRRSDSQLVVEQVNREYETRDQRMAKYVTLIKLRLGSFMAWRLEQVPRSCNEKADALPAVAASLPIKETMLFLVYYQPESSIITNQVNEIDEIGPSWMTSIAPYLSLGELPNNKTEAYKIQV